MHAEQQQASDVINVATAIAHAGHQNEQLIFNINYHNAHHDDAQLK